MYIKNNYENIKIQSLNNLNPNSRWGDGNWAYILPIENAIELGRFGGKFVAPIQIHTVPTFQDGYLNVQFDFDIAGNYDLPDNCFLCNIYVLDQVVKNVPIYLENKNSFADPTIFTYKGEVKINILNNWLKTKLHNKTIELKIVPFLNPQFIGTIPITMGGGSLEEFMECLNDKCQFKSYYQISNYFEQNDLTKNNYENWIPIDYIHNYQYGLKPEIKKLIRPNYYFEPISNLNYLTKPLISPWITNASGSPDQIFSKSKIILYYQVLGQNLKKIEYDYQLPNNNKNLEFNLGFKTIYDFQTHEIKIVSNNNDVGTDGIFFPEPTNFNLKFIFQDEKNYGCYYTETINGKFNNNFWEKDKLNLKIEELNSEANGEWNSIIYEKEIK